jgi:hypothetical protein
MSSSHQAQTLDVPISVRRYGHGPWFGLEALWKQPLAGWCASLVKGPTVSAKLISNSANDAMTGDAFGGQRAIKEEDEIQLLWL